MGEGERRGLSQFGKREKGFCGKLEIGKGGSKCNKLIRKKEKLRKNVASNSPAAEAKKGPKPIKKD